MDVSNKIREIKSDIEKLSAEEKILKNRIAELKLVADERKQKLSNIEELRKQEAALVAELGL